MKDSGGVAGVATRLLQEAFSCESALYLIPRLHLQHIHMVDTLLLSISIQGNEIKRGGEFRLRELGDFTCGSSLATLYKRTHVQ